MSLKPPFKNLNALCSPDPLLQAVPESRTIVAECSPSLGFQTLGTVKRPVPEDLRMWKADLIKADQINKIVWDRLDT